MVCACIYAIDAQSGLCGVQACMHELVIVALARYLIQVSICSETSSKTSESIKLNISVLKSMPIGWEKENQWCNHYLSGTTECSSHIAAMPKCSFQHIFWVHGWKSTR